jgi:hypothetical protein
MKSKIIFQIQILREDGSPYFWALQEDENYTRSYNDIYENITILFKVLNFEFVIS